MERQRKSLSLSLNQLRGDLRDKIATIKKSVLDLAAHINVSFRLSWRKE